MSAFYLKSLPPTIVCWGRTLYTLITRLAWNIHAHMRAHTGTFKKRVRLEKLNFEGSENVTFSETDMGGF